MIYEENGKIIVDELRPMSEAPRDLTEILAFHKIFEEMMVIYWFNEKWTFNNFDHFEYINEDELEGFIPMPEYRRKE